MKQKQSFWEIFPPIKKRRMKLERKQKEEAKLEATKESIGQTLNKTIDIQEKSVSVQKDTKDTSEKITSIYAELQEKEQLLLKREEKLREDEADFDKRKSKFSDREAELRTRASLVNHEYEKIRLKEELADKKDKDLDREREDIKEREDKADLSIKNSEQKKQKYIEKLDTLNTREEELERFQEQLDERYEACLEKEAEANRYYEEQKAAHDILQAEKERLEREYEETNKILQSKMEKYDRKLEDMESLSETMSSVEFDNSPEGQQAKIVVKEALRTSIKSMKDSIERLEEIDELYNKGTFQGFAIPLVDIEKTIETVEQHFESIREHNAASEDIFSLLKNKFTELCKELFPLIPNLRIGIIFYLDHDSHMPYVTKPQPLTNDIQKLQMFINTAATAEWGNSFEEAVEDALNDLLQIGWKEGNTRSVVLFGDAQPHEPNECRNGYDYFELTKKLYDQKTTINSVYCGRGTLLNNRYQIGDFSSRVSQLGSAGFFSWIAAVTGGVSLTIDQVDDLSGIIMGLVAKDAGKLDELEEKLKISKINIPAVALAEIQKQAKAIESKKKTLRIGSST